MDEPLKVTRTTWSSGAKLDRSRAALPPLGATRRFAAGAFGVREDLLHRAFLHHNAAVQNSNVIADLFHNAHLMGDDHHRDAQLLVDVLDQGQDGVGGVGSSALVASSQSRTLGSVASARAMAMRCFWPPDSCAG